MQFCLIGFLACILRGAETSAISPLNSISYRNICASFRGPRDRIRRSANLLRMSGSGEPATRPHIDDTGCRHHVIFPDPSEGTNLALIMVNYKLQKKLLELVWPTAAVRICADGAINRLYHLFETDEERRRYIPEYVRGDCDSLEAGIREYYLGKGTKIVYDSNQDTTDLEKCIDLLQTLPLQIAQAIVFPYRPFRLSLSALIDLASPTSNRLAPPRHLWAPAKSIRARPGPAPAVVLTSFDAPTLPPTRACSPSLPPPPAPPRPGR